MTDRIRWGIAATGGIAASFAEGLAQTPDAELVAVASRSQERADAFGDRFAVPRRHSSYAALADDDGVDVVYVASPQSRHVDDVLLFLDAGRAVLCEKPFALDRAQATRMVEAARARDVFLMEAMWSRFLPAYVRLRELLAEGRIGEPRLVEADFGFRLPDEATGHRLLDPDLGGGGLLDLGVYPVQLCSLVLGVPDRVGAVGHVGPSGVDEQVAAVLGHPGGAVGVVKAAVRTPMASTARIAGTEGVVELPAMMHCPGALRVVSASGIEDLDLPIEGQGLRYQVPEVHRCLREGRRESDVMALDETLSTMGTLDRIRTEVGIHLPGSDLV
ncbi:Gfo/Idh/MocA family oxidoreductase [Iamia majanohamensis]|uniref:Gfo/Idh/MocA family oxidoreductase n=1 Tax=Iamia majanohamensis TaxID=467976 RepID=A0AAE9Y7T7_9ACTN|nr:Gfo/Idh/MocA family oxidoreductase [Iamia majanohamensis]WCO66028.1 Gfo/Idh/MocA family oxidoreductase [Iamia majanohamensis]